MSRDYRIFWTRWILMGLSLVVVAGISCRRPAQASPKKLAFITSGVDPIWELAWQGVRQATQEFGVTCQFWQPRGGLMEQRQMVENLLATQVDGLAISLIDPSSQNPLVNHAAGQTIVLTHSIDAPESKRAGYVGANPYKTGRQVGQLVKEAVPQGGKVLLLAGRLESRDVQERRQGIIDELLGRPAAAGEISFDPLETPIIGSLYTIVGTELDQFDYARATANARQALNDHPDLAAMVGLFAHNIPSCLMAVREMGRTGKVKLVSFDDAEAILAGIADGSVYGTVAPQSHLIGYHAVRLLALLARGQTPLPAGGFFEVEMAVIRASNLEAYREEQQRLRKRSL